MNTNIEAAFQSVKDFDFYEAFTNNELEYIIQAMEEYAKYVAFAEVVDGQEKQQELLLYQNMAQTILKKDREIEQLKSEIKVGSQSKSESPSPVPEGAEEYDITVKPSFKTVSIKAKLQIQEFNPKIDIDDDGQKAGAEELAKALEQIRDIKEFGFYSTMVKEMKEIATNTLAGFAAGKGEGDAVAFYLWMNDEVNPFVKQGDKYIQACGNSTSWTLDELYQLFKSKSTDHV